MVNDLAQNNVMDILNIIVALVITFGGGIFSFISARFLGPKWKMEREAAKQVAQEKLRNSLHMAAVTGVTKGTEQGLTGVALIRFALIHMVKSVPEAIIKLTPTPKEIFDSGPAETVLKKIPPQVRDVLENIVESKIGGATFGEAVAGEIDTIKDGVQEAARKAMEEMLNKHLNFGVDRIANKPVPAPNR